MQTQLTKGIHWVGVIDWNLRDFHGYAVRGGSTYNAYLVLDEKTALIDTVKAPFGSELLDKVRAHVPLDRVDYVVCNHAELDHAGALPQVMAACPNATLVCDAKCKDELALHFDISGWRVQVVDCGGAISLGRRTLQFVTTPMVHWPESMVTYIPEDRLLFSMDAFGQHLATTARFDDEVPLDAILEEARRYFANILMPFGRPINRAIDALAALPLDIVAPSHGVIWRKNFAAIVAAYRAWTECRPAPRVLVVYDSMWKSTEAMARAIVEGAGIEGVEAKLLHLRQNAMAEIVNDLLDAPCVALGSPVQNNMVMPQVGALMTYLRGLKPTRKAGFFFGSYGWSRNAAADEVAKFFEAVKFDVVREPLLNQFVPKAECLEACREAGRALAEEALRRAKAAEPAS